jgi:hypothetical protein
MAPNSTSSEEISVAQFAARYRSFLITGLAFLFIMMLGLFYFYIPEALRGRPDFRQLYTAGYMVRTGLGQKLFDSGTVFALQNKLCGALNIPLPFNHLAYETIFFAPLSVMSFKAAYVTFFGINLGLMWLSFQMLRPYVMELRVVWSWLPAALFVCFFPVGIAFIQGQDSILMLTLFMAAMVAHRRGRDMLAGSLLALTLFKFQFAVPVILLFAAWKMWKAVLGFGMTGAIVAATSLWITGLSAAAAYLRSLLSMSVTLRTMEQQDSYGIHPIGMPNLRGLLTALLGSITPHDWTQAILVAASLTLLVFAARSKPSFSLAVLVSVMISYHSLIHDTVLLIIPIGLIVAACIRGQLPQIGWASGIAAAMLSLPTLVYPARPWVLAIPSLALIVLHLVQLKSLYGRAISATI